MPGSRPTYPISAVYRNTAPAPTSPWVIPGQYTVKLTVNGQSYTQPLTIKMDPRVRTPPADLTQQFTLSKQLYDDIVATGAVLEQLHSMRKQLRELKDRAGQGDGAALDQKAGELEGAGPPARRGVPEGPDTLTSVSASLDFLMGLLQEADVAPTSQAVAAKYPVASVIGFLNGISRASTSAPKSRQECRLAG